MTLQVIGLCRFSYPAIGGFQVEHETMEERIDYLYDEARIDERFHLFEAVALPSLRAQTDPDFELIIVVGDQMPAHHRDRLDAIISDMPQARIHAEPPRPQREVMKKILNAARRDFSQPCLQFRFDDDDAVAIDFVERLRKAAKDCDALLQQHKSVAFDWNKGYIAEYSSEGIAATEIFRPFDVAALGMWVKGDCHLTIMNFAHNKIDRFMPAVSFDEPRMFVRGHNASNDSRQKPVKPVHLKPFNREQSEAFRKRFAIDVEKIRQIFGGT
ncbi:putative rhamnosyl transferase [Sulfitobacter guttiformis]|uniref:Putative rhamnosyltransferase n=1 Tax=Sulfitobacter guttiformis TaxID=74349 RepID=A0A420DQD6_9RHOB|nr:putative rhamnosyl transferase [Sulfitobacter guttiformis]KIN73888.1 Rhamno transf domain containing protein [Sulfitobacter guttiformis KCTC 32187]RKE96521.1 putative rhamnosyltransferase [Sulfitobacter guttiformis]